ncbi:MAG: DUF1080 domain-containing protein [Cyclobacteriaceae bacterium]|nr:DUF1080 domain-containing protein [Cyclobacteriaceae bacterium]
MIRSMTVKILGVMGLMMLASWIFWTLALDSSSSAKASEQQAEFISLFDGKSLEGWEFDPVYWSVKEGAIVGEITPETVLKNNTFIIWKGGELADFELKVDFWISEKGNSGVQYRSDRFTEVPYALRGYQADIDGGNLYTGQNYEERKRTTLAYRGQKTQIAAAPDSITSIGGYVNNNAWKGLVLVEELGDRAALGNLIKKGEWNTIHIVAKGNLMKHYVNGTLMSEVLDADAKNRKLSGLLGFQVHVGPPMKVMFKNILLKKG